MLENLSLVSVVTARGLILPNGFTRAFLKPPTAADLRFPPYSLDLLRREGLFGHGKNGSRRRNVLKIIIDKVETA